MWDRRNLVRRIGGRRVPMTVRFAQLGSSSDTPAQFKQRLQRVEDHLNSAAFAAPGGTGLLGLAKELRPRCQKVVDLKGERVPK